MRLTTASIALAGLVVLLGAAPREVKAPAITGHAWLNTDPIAPEELRGKVALVEFWAFDCINCQRTIPAMRQLYATYRDSGVVIVGVHSPELDHERSTRNVKAAVTRLDVRYPVVIDGDLAIWEAFHNQYWPCLYVVDKRGVIRLTHIGELHEGTPAWDELQTLIETLRREPA